MTFSKHRVVIDAYKEGDIAYKWCADNVPLSEWLLRTHY